MTIQGSRESLMREVFSSFADALPEAGRRIVYYSKNKDGQYACWVGVVVSMTQEEVKSEFEEVYDCGVSVHPFCDKYYVRLDDPEGKYGDEAETLNSDYDLGKFVDGVYEDEYLFSLGGVWTYYPDV